MTRKEYLEKKEKATPISTNRGEITSLSDYLNLRDQIVEFEQQQIRCLFSDAGRRFNPVEHIGESPGLRLITQLLHNQYRWQNNRNYFCIKATL